LFSESDHCNQPCRPFYHGLSTTTTTTTTTVLWPFFQDHPGEPVPEKNFWTLWCKRRLTEADTPTIWLGATPSPSLHFYRSDAHPAAQPTEYQSTEGN